MGQLNRQMRLWSVATPIALAASLGFHAPAQESPAAALAQAEARWQEHGPKAYRFGINLTCFCDLRGMSFRVVDGLVQIPRDANAASRGFHDRYGTVEKLFAVIRRAVENGAHRIVVKYDTKLGYPIWADIDRRREVFDDELFFRVSGFRTLNEPTTAAQSPAPLAKQTKPLAAPQALNDGWKTATLEQAGIERQRLEQMTDAIRANPDFNIHAVLIEHGGRLVYEQYFSGSDQRWGTPLGVVNFNRDTLHDLRSVTKSVVSALVGIASSSKAIPSLDAPLLDSFPELNDLRVPERQRITIRHALMMSVGLEWNEDVPYTDPKNDEIVMIKSPDPMRYVLSRPIMSAPGTVWQYNGGATQVLGTIVQRATKQPLADYARQMLFSPLGITEFEWLGNLAGVPSAASGLRLRPRDLAKFASLYLHDGQWNGRQVIPREWVHESTRRRLTLPKQPSRGYGYQWWHACFSTPSGPVEAPTAIGNGAQRVFVLRSRRTVVTFLAGRYNDFSASPPDRLLLDFILPALPAAPATTCPS